MSKLAVAGADPLAGRGVLLAIPAAGLGAPSPAGAMTTRGGTAAGAGATTTGADAADDRVKLSETFKLPSLAVTLISSEANPAGGVPVNVPVAGLKVSHRGSGEPLARVALYASALPSGSVKALAGRE
jgi:hypothetical protein